MKKLASVTVYFDYEDYTMLKRVAQRLSLSESSIVRMCVMYVLKEVLPYMTIDQFVREAVREKVKGGVSNEA